MDTFQIQYSYEAFEDLCSIYKYIAEDLKVPSTALNQVNIIRKSINTLNSLPLRNKEVEWSPWKDLHIRQLIIYNYIVFYSVNESTKEVFITRIIYSRRNIQQIAKDNN